MRNTYVKIFDVIKYSFCDLTLLEMALTHSSTRRDHKATYQRLEFLGDRILSVAVATMLYDRFAEHNEGDLTLKLIYLVRKETVAQIARELGIADFIYVGHDQGADNCNILCDVMEALIGAIYLDSSIDDAITFVRRHWSGYIHESADTFKDTKTRLQEWSQKMFKTLPQYETIDAQGEAHAPLFTVRVTVSDMQATATGGSKRDAQMQAAAKLLNNITIS